MAPHFDARTISAYRPTDPRYTELQVAQTQHHIDLVLMWGIREGERVLELGAGQGDCTAVLATAVGERGRVVAVDPTPHARAGLRVSPVGHRIKWHATAAGGVLGALHAGGPAAAATYDTVVLAHCVWYLAAPSVLLETLRTLAPRTGRICLAEYSLAASDATSIPHVMAALAHASLECRKPPAEAHIRTVLSPRRIKQIVTDAGLVVYNEGIVKAPANMSNGKWEVSAVLGKEFRQDVEFMRNERERAVIEALLDSIRSSNRELTQAGLNITTMDVWYGVVTRP